MCGILCEIYKQCSPSKNEEILQRLWQRGPDCTQTVATRVSDDVEITFRGSVLWMQGPRLTPQPVEDKSGILLFNGDIFDETWTNEVSDTQALMNKLSERVANNREDHIIKVIKSLKGPFALIYYDKMTNNLYFTRDRIGRSSLLFHMEDSKQITLSSVLGRNYKGCLEVPAANIYSFNIEDYQVHVHSWTDYLEPDVYKLGDWMQNLDLEQNLPDDEFGCYFDTNIDLNDNDNIADFIENTGKETTDKHTVLTKLMSHPSIKEVVFKIVELLQDSVKIRLRKQPNRCNDCLSTEEPCGHCTVGILFSGGLDCTILAFLADKFLPESQIIDLINVAFRKSDTANFDVPDRLTGRQSYEELKQLCPSRIWNFMEVDVEKEELEEFQSSIIADLVYPRKTILDESLGSALWFAARGNDKKSTSSCRVLILGSGADELFGGYIRHRNAYKRRGWPGLAKELMLDWNRISIRNLSRDNRVISHHGRQPRMPYLDDNFTEYVLKLKPWFKCFPSEQLGPGIGDKLMLRLVAHSLGLRKVVCFPKRALQFGTKIANKKERGADISQSFSCR